MRTARPALLVLLLACGKEPESTPPPKATSEAWFRLALKRCFVFKPEGGGIEERTMYVEGIETALVQGKQIWRVVWRRNGQDPRDDFYEAAPDALLLHRRQSFDTPLSTTNRIKDYDPPPPLMLVDGSPGDRRDVITHVHDRLAGETGATRDESWSVLLVSTKTIPAAGENVTAIKAAVSATDGSSVENNDYYFAAQKGLVAFRPHGTQGLWVLDRVADDAAECPPN